MSRSQPWLFSLFALFGVAPALAAETPVRVAILLFDGVQIIDFAAPYEVFGQAGYEVYTVSRDGKGVQTAMDLRVEVDHDFASAPVADVLVIPGGNVDAAAADPETQAWIRQRAEPARQVLSICTGSDILASTGLLDGQSATTFHRHFEHMAQRFPAVTVVQDQRWVQAGKLVTSAGLSSGMDAALHVVAQLDGERRARSVALHLEYDWSPQQGFVRGLLADRQLRLPDARIDYPEGVKLSQRSAVGDRAHWEIEYQIEGPLPPAELLARVRAAALSDDGLQVVSEADAPVLIWRYVGADQRQWEVQLSVTAPADTGASYQAWLKLAPAG